MTIAEDGEDISRTLPFIGYLFIALKNDSQGIWILWNPLLEWVLGSSMLLSISTILIRLGVLTRVYAQTNPRKRKSVFENIKEISQQLNGPHLVPCDLNVIGNHADKVGVGGTSNYSLDL